MNSKFENLGVKPADILLPKAGTDMHRWAVVACDQFTSQPEYWEEVDRIAGDAPSTLRLILPESMLNDANVDQHIADIKSQTKETKVACSPLMVPVRKNPWCVAKKVLG